MNSEYNCPANVLLCANTNVGLCTLLIIFAIVNVLPEPVTPSNVWYFFPASIPLDKYSIACGWSPVGLYSECNLNIFPPIF